MARRYHSLLLALLLLGCFWLNTGNLLAQDQNYITGIDCQSLFPTCLLKLNHPALGETPPAEALTVQVDGEATPLTSFERKPTALQVAFVLDAPDVVRKQGIAPRFTEAVRKLLAWFQASSLGDAPLNDDQWTVYLIGATAPDEFTPSEWQQGDFGAFINKVEGLVTGLAPNGPETTTLFSPVLKALERFQDNQAVKILVLFSDGFDRSTSPGRAMVIQEALKKNVHIYTVMHWDGGGQVGIDNLSALATATGGLFVKMTNVDDLTPIWEVLAKEHTPAVAAFVLPKAAPQSLMATLTLPDGSKATETVTFPAIAIPPLQIAGITVNGSPESRIMIAPDAMTLEIQLALAAPGSTGNLAERIDRVEYQFGDERFPQKAPPFEQYSLPLAESRLGETPRALIVHVFDKFGPTLRSDPINISRQPLPPTNTPEPPPTETAAPPTETPASPAIPTAVVATLEPVATVPPTGMAAVTELVTTLAQQMGLGAVSPPVLWAGFVGGPLLLIGLVAFVIVWLRKRDEQPYALPTTTWAQPADGGDTQPADMDDSTNPAMAIFARATLILERGGSEVPKEIALYPQQAQGVERMEWKLGRSFAHCDHVIEDRDKRVSRWHATIFEQDEKFFIKDEGSAGGTYINRKQLEPQNPTRLLHNDVINFNTIAYRFLIGDVQEGASSTIDPDATQVSDTQRFGE